MGDFKVGVPRYQSTATQRTRQVIQPTSRGIHIALQSPAYGGTNKTEPGATQFPTTRKLVAPIASNLGILAFQQERVKTCLLRDGAAGLHCVLEGYAGDDKCLADSKKRRAGTLQVVNGGADLFVNRCSLLIFLIFCFAERCAVASLAKMCSVFVYLMNRL